MAVKLTTEQKQYIENNYNVLSQRKLAEELNVPKGAVRWHIIKNGLQCPSRIRAKKPFEERRVTVYVGVKFKYRAIVQKRLDEMAKDYR